MSARMDPQHPEWDAFRERLEGEDGCNFHDGPKGITWNCGGCHDKSHAERILLAMGLSKKDVAASLKYFDEHGGHCDCEILFNVGVA